MKTLIKKTPALVSLPVEWTDEDWAKPLTVRARPANRLARPSAGSRASCARRFARGPLGRRAFTLIELLVVIAIIAVLAGLLLASLAIQLLALATPLFTQVVIDKVVVHRTQSTLIALMTGMTAIAFFTAVLSWLRQYLVLHTGNRVDGVLGSAVFERLLKLPPMYFHYRPTGVITARLGGIESIREFIASAAVTLILDIPFVLIFLAIMVYYSVQLTLVVCALLLLLVP